MPAFGPVRIVARPPRSRHDADQVASPGDHQEANPSFHRCTSTCVVERGAYLAPTLAYWFAAVPFTPK